MREAVIPGVEEFFPEAFEDFFPEFPRLEKAFEMFGSHLYPEATGLLKKSLLDSGLNAEASKYLSSRIPCSYLFDQHEDSNYPRYSRFKQDFDAIYQSAIQLERSLKASAIESLIYIRYFMGDDYAEERMINSPLLQMRNSIFNRNLLYEKGPVDPKFLFLLSDLAETAKSARDGIPSDAGSPVSGDHDSSGVMARKRLALNIRLFLKRRGKPYGAHKGGAVSRFLSCVHESATGQAPSWADRFAAMTPQLEEESKREEKSLAERLESIEASCAVDEVRRNIRLRAYYAQTGEKKP